ncbi:MAG: DUF1588 domain-containing protein [Clostridia bacterium]|nr:DUF1588 domain-containing protein [Deltaproteobacteria bacterium]
MHQTTIAVILAALVGGCVGQIDDTPSVTATSTAKSCGATTLPAVTVRRLTRDEYRNSVIDLFGVTPPDASSLPEDAVVRSFTSTINQQVNAAAVGKYFTAADGLATKLLEGGKSPIVCTGDETGCVRAYLSTSGTRIARRPLTPGEVTHYVGVFERTRTTATYDVSASVMLSAMLASPQFLFLSATNTGDTDDLYGVAAHLSYALWHTTPDDELLETARTGQLAESTVLTAQAERLVRDERARAPVRAFFNEWLTLDRIAILDVVENHPDATSEVVAALDDEVRAFVDDAFFTHRDLRKLFVSSTRFRNKVLSNYYGDDLATTDTIESYSAPPSEQFFGLLSHAGWLMAAGYNDSTSMIHRGKFLSTRLLCADLPPPPPGVATSLPDLTGSRTMRERITAHTAGQECQSCHSVMNPMGFPLGHFDNSGRWQDTEAGVAIDATTSIAGLGDLDGAYQLSQALAESKTMHTCVATMALTRARGDRVRGSDDCLIRDMTEKLAASGYDVAALLADLTVRQVLELRGKGE